MIKCVVTYKLLGTQFFIIIVYLVLLNKILTCYAWGHKITAMKEYNFWEKVTWYPSWKKIFKVDCEAWDACVLLLWRSNGFKFKMM